MPYAVNVMKGSKLFHSDVGELPGGIAIPINEEQARIAKHLINVVVFDKVAGRDEDKDFKSLYGFEKNMMKPKTEEIRRYQDFVSEHKDVKIASQKWDEYKQEMLGKGVRL